MPFPFACILSEGGIPVRAAYCSFQIFLVISLVLRRRDTKPRKNTCSYLLFLKGYQLSKPPSRVKIFLLASLTGFFSLTGFLRLVKIFDFKRREKSCYLFFCMLLPVSFHGFFSLTGFLRLLFQGIQAKGKGIGYYGGPTRRF
jgi:hypothetical protein